MDKAYAAFLASSDLPTWLASLSVFERLLAGGKCDDSLLAGGACLATYVRWLGYCSGDDDVRKRAESTLQRFAAAGARAIDESPAATHLGEAIVLAASRYKRTAAELLSHFQNLGPDVLVLIAPSASPAKLAAYLRDAALHPGGCSFLPAFHSYCSALLQLGRISEVLLLIKERHPLSYEPLILDLLGEAYERSGRWHEALASWESSSWPSHILRAALCRIISGDYEGGLRQVRDSLENRAIQQALLAARSEVDQLELARSAAFVDACRWSSLEGWLVDLELAKLSFSRRRHWDVMEQLSGTEQSCPAHALYAIRSLRFYNLSWLSAETLSNRISLLPEALEAAFSALEAAQPGDHNSDIRVWIARCSNRHEVLGPVLSSPQPFDVPQAEAIIGTSLGEVTSLLACVGAEYSPRALYQSINWFADVHFFNTAGYLTELVLKESDDDFFALWELGNSLLELRSSLSQRSPALQQLNQHIRIVSNRLQELSRFDFQHLVRAFEFFHAQNRHDIAELLLARAAKLADGCEENLAVAVLRRPNGRFGGTEGNQQGLSCLLRAERAATHRIDHLQIARELCQYGQVQRARLTLQKTGAFEDSSVLTHAEFIAALQCGPWLDPAEFQSLAARAFAAAVRELRSAKARFGGLFLRRVLTVIADVNPGLAEHLFPNEAFPTPSAQLKEEEASPTPKLPTAGEKWVALVKDTLRVPSRPHKDDDLPVRLRQVKDTWPAAPLALWRVLLGALSRSEASADRSLPEIDPSEVPVCKEPGFGARTAAMHQLWQAYAGAEADDARQTALADLQAFQEEDERFLNQWQDLRCAGSEADLRTAALYSERACAVLTAIGELQPFATHSSLIMRTLAGHLQTDAKECLTLIDRRRIAILNQLRQNAKRTPPRTSTPVRTCAPH